MGIVMLAVSWVGYVGSDDHSYARGAIGWLEHFPFVGDDHWTLRNTVVLPIAASLALVGFRELSLGLPSALSFLLFLAFNHHFLWQFLGRRPAMVGSLLLATTPLFTVQATFPQDTIATLLAVSASFWLFFAATRHERPAWRMFGAGVAAALGFLTLEIAAGLLLFYGLLFLIGFGVSRRYYWIMALGFLLVVGAEIAYLGALTGDPVYRYRIDLSHDVVDRAGDAQAASRAGSTLNLEGNLVVPALVDPVVGLLINQEFGLLFWAYLPAAIWAWRTRGGSPESRQLLRLLVGAGLVWMVFVSLCVSVLYVVPRYYGVFSWSAAIVVACWLSQSLFVRWPRTATALGAAIILGNLLCVYVENKNPLFGERELVAYVERHGGLVYTDPMTVTRAKLLLEFAGVSDRVRAGAPPQGTLFYSNAQSVERCKQSGHRCPWPWENYVPGRGWTEHWRKDPPRKLSGMVLGSLGLERVIPEAIFRRLDRPHGSAVVYVVSGEPASPSAVGNE